MKKEMFMTAKRNNKTLKRPTNRQAVVVDGIRTPFVKSFGVFQHCDALELYSRVVDGLLKRQAFDPVEIDEIACGVVIPQTKNPNVARDTIMNLGLPDHIHGYTLNRACTSSLHTIADAAKAIAYGQHQLVLAGGVECLSDVPITYSKEAKQFLMQLQKAKTTGERLMALTYFSAKDWIPKPPGLAEPLTGFSMGEHAEMMAKINNIAREDQDQVALRSHHRAAEAQNFLAGEIVPVWPAPKYETMIPADNMVRADTSLEALSALRPVFDRQHGRITAGNASPLTDGAAVNLIADETFAKELGLKPQARIKDFCFVGVTPHPQLLLGPAVAIPMLLKRNGLSLADIDCYEIHEAFAAQVLSCVKCMADPEFMEKHFGDSKGFGELDMERVNRHGGAIAIGHPFGATGSRLVTTLTRSLKHYDKNLGLIAICAAGGMAAAMLIERLDS
jgi:acetyl-CoA acetyltransferase family protein